MRMATNNSDKRKASTEDSRPFLSRLETTTMRSAGFLPALLVVVICEVVLALTSNGTEKAFSLFLFGVHCWFAVKAKHQNQLTYSTFVWAIPVFTRQTHTIERLESLPEAQSLLNLCYQLVCDSDPLSGTFASQDGQHFRMSQSLEHLTTSLPVLYTHY